jgi:hypothetical protein
MLDLSSWGTEGVSGKQSATGCGRQSGKISNWAKSVDASGRGAVVSQRRVSRRGDDQAGVAELADALDSKSSIRNWVCGFESLLRH